ncbi:hypothetical protein HDU91_006822 [Kappamyces sp. JEL0680]|nr:hypothetical protein HDU91_006822 [Kappamyces sp. JEL0680]
MGIAPQSKATVPEGKRKRDEEVRGKPGVPEEKKAKKDENEVIPLHLRPRKLNFWDQKPVGYEGMSADQAKATGMFLLPSHLLKGTGSFSQPAMIGASPYGSGPLMLGYGSAAVKEQQKTGYHTKRLYVSGFGPQCTEDEIVQWFNNSFEERRLPKDPGNPVLSCQIHEKGFAFIELRSSHEATTALTLDGREFMGRPLKVQRPKDYAPGEEDPNYIPGVISPVVGDSIGKVFIGGIPPYVTEEQVMDLLKAFGELKSFNLVKAPDTGVSKGFAFCEYVNPAITDLACEGLHGLELGDKKLIVQRAHSGAVSKLAMMEGALPGAGLGRALLPIEILGANGLKPAEPTIILMLLNLFDGSELENDEFYAEVLQDITEELERFGTVHEVYIPRPVKGEHVIGIGRVRIGLLTW